jgi:hypothetical protein
MLALILALFAGQCFGAVDDAYTVSLQHFDLNLIYPPEYSGPDESGKTWAGFDGAHATATMAKFGAGSIALGGTDDYISTPDSADFAPGTAPFTIDFWVYPWSVSSTRILCSQAVSSGNRWILYLSSGNLRFFASNGVSFNSSSILEINKWQHIALTRNGSDWRLFFNGVQTGYLSSANALVDPAADFCIGKQALAGSEFFYLGYIDEFRFSNGIARWTGNFTPPTDQYGTSTIPSSPARISLMPGSGIGFGSSIGRISF